jgi:hypothetical protein
MPPRTTRIEDPFHFLDLAFGYYMTGRFAFINRLCVAPNLKHHAVELLIKFTLLKDVPESQRSDATADLGKKHGHRLKALSGNGEPTLPAVDDLPAIHTLPSHGMGSALEWLIWAPCVTIASDGPRAPSRRSAPSRVSNRVALCNQRRAKQARQWSPVQERFLRRGSWEVRRTAFLPVAHRCRAVRLSRFLCAVQCGTDSSCRIAEVVDPF